MNEVTEADVLAGEKVIELELRNGERLDVKVKGLPWRDYLRASFLPLVEANIAMITGGLPKGFREDEFLDQVAPDSLARVGVTVSHLTTGLAALKKRVRANGTPGTASPTLESPSLPSSMPSANSSKPDTAEPQPGPQAS